MMLVELLELNGGDAKKRKQLEKLKRGRKLERLVGRLERQRGRQRRLKRRQLVSVVPRSEPRGRLHVKLSSPYSLPALEVVPKPHMQLRTRLTMDL